MDRCAVNGNCERVHNTPTRSNPNSVDFAVEQSLIHIVATSEGWYSSMMDDSVLLNRGEEVQVFHKKLLQYSLKTQYFIDFTRFQQSL